jgi:hypothetical protein
MGEGFEKTDEIKDARLSASQIVTPVTRPRIQESQIVTGPSKHSDRTGQFVRGEAAISIGREYRSVISLPHFPEITAK